MPKTHLLNEEQIQAIEHGDGPLLIIAGAGTGKTTVVTERIKYLINTKNVSSNEILALTFTEKAAREMEERIDVAMPYGYNQMWISTFHSFCDRVLRKEAIHIGLNPEYDLVTEAESTLFIRKHLFNLQLEYFRPLGNPTKFLSGLLQHFSRLKDEDITPEEYLSFAKKLEKENDDQDEVKKNLELAHAYITYEDLKAKEGIMDFSDLISNTLKLFRERKNVLKEYQEKFKYILLDEFQDTNYAQNELAILLAGIHKNITVVGDDDQAIYRWRGAAVSNMIQFKKNFPDVKIITLIKNYRSTQEILEKSHKVIQNNNPDRLEVKENVNKKLISERQIKGDSIEFIFTDRVENEAEEVVKKIQQLVLEKKLAYKDIAILIRANDHSQPFIRTLQRYNIPYQFLGPGRLFHQEEIKDLIAYLKVLYSFEDSTSLYRILSMPIFDLHPRDIATLLNYAKRKNYSLFEMIERIANQKNTEESEVFLREGVNEKINNIYTMLSSHLKKVPTDTAGQILYYFLHDSGLLKRMIEVQSDEEAKQYENIAKFFDKLKTFEAERENASVFAVVEWIDLLMQMGESPLASDSDWSENNAVNILTIHSSKGLEFPVVFLVNLVGQRFPTRERSEQIPIPQQLIKEFLPEGDYHLQEERRLFYVGMTRARDMLFLTAASFYGEGKRERKISPFVVEVFGENVTSQYIKKKPITKIAFQQSLLDWAPENTLQIAIPEQKHTIPSITYVSYSQIQCFEICPLHYKLKYLLKIPGTVTSSQSFGTSIHSALRDFYTAFMQDKTTPRQKIESFLKKNWINEGYQSKVHEKQAFEKAHQIVTNYLKEYFSPETAKPLAIEVPFSITIKDSTTHPSLKVGGRIDRVDEITEGKIEVIDYKTGSNIPGEKELARNLQLTMYGFAAHFMKSPPFNKNPEDILLSLFYLEEDIKLSTVRSLEELEECKSEIFRKVEEIEKSDFLCSKNILCDNCEYKILCSTKV